MALVTSYDQAKIDDLLADLQTWATANLAPITEPLAVNAQNAANAAQADVDTLDAQVVKLTGNQTVAGVKNFTDSVYAGGSDNYFGDGAIDGDGPYLDIGNLGTGSCWVDARGSAANIALYLRAKGASNIVTNSKLEVAAGMMENSVIVNGASYSATLADRTIVVNVASTITLPNNGGGLYQGKRYTIINNGTGMVTISTTGGMVDFTSTLPPRHVINLWTDGFGYYSEDPTGVIRCTSSTKPTGNLYSGLTIYETNTGKTLIYDGSAWQISGDVGAWTTYTPSSTGLTGATIAGRWRYLGPKSIHIMLAVNAGTLTTQGIAPSLSLPAGITTDSFMTQALSANFSANTPILARAAGSGTAVHLSHTDVTGTQFSAGQSYANARVSGVLAVV